MGKSNVSKELREILEHLESIKEHLEDIYECCEDMRDEISDEFEDSEEYIGVDELCENLSTALDNVELTINDVENCLK